MRRHHLSLLLAALSCLAIQFGAPWAEAAFAERLSSYFTGSGAADLQLRLTALLGPLAPSEARALSLLSFAFWCAAALIAARSPWAEHYLPLLFHPASVLLAAAGFGLAGAAMLLVFVAYERALAVGTPAAVPGIGIAYLIAALALPAFGSLLICLVAPLFALAPRAMLERNMASFYLVACLPAVIATVLIHMSGPAAVPQMVPSVQAGGLVPLLFLAPALPLAAGTPAMRRLLFVLSVVSFGIAMTSTLPAQFRMLTAALAAAFALHGRASLAWQLGGGAGVALAVIVLSAEMG